MTTFARTYDNDAERVRLGIKDRTKVFGPLETTTCAHGQIYSFRYEWPAGSGGPNDGDLVILTNQCIDCSLALELQPGRRRT